MPTCGERQDASAGVTEKSELVNGLTYTFHQID